MPKDWPYAALSKLAKSVGGPEHLIEKLISKGKNEGRIEMIPAVLVAAIGAATATKLIDKFRSKNQKELDETKEELINGINEYDKEHPDNENE